MTVGSSSTFTRFLLINAGSYLVNLRFNVRRHLPKPAEHLLRSDGLPLRLFPILGLRQARVICLWFHVDSNKTC